MAEKYNRSAEDIGNILGLEHVNLWVPDQRLATLFYITGLGLTRDPYLVTGVTNMWVNVGCSQFHLPTRGTQVLRGHAGLVVPDLEALARQLESVRADLADTKFDFTVSEDRIDVICPWGNRMRLHAPDPRFGPIQLGMPYICFDAPPGSAEGIAKFYRDVLRAEVRVERENGTTAAHVSTGYRQELIFRETAARIFGYDGHHIQLYVANFSGPHAALAERGLVTEESNQHQYRFVDIVDPDSGERLYRLEHEIRAMSHPLFGRQLANRNPAQTNASFATGYDERPWRLPA